MGLVSRGGNFSRVLVTILTLFWSRLDLKASSSDQYCQAISQLALIPVSEVEFKFKSEFLFTCAFKFKLKSQR